MPTKEMSTHYQSFKIHDAAIAADGNTNTQIIDTANFDLGVTFTIGASAYTDGTFTLSFQEGDDPALSDAVTVPAEKLVGAASISAVTALGGQYAQVGIHSTARYVRPVITAASVTSGATIEVNAHMFAEVIPVEHI